MNRVRINSGQPEGSSQKQFIKAVPPLPHPTHPLLDKLNYLFGEPQSIRQVVYKSGLDPFFVCRYVAFQVYQGEIHKLYKGLCPIADSMANFYTTDYDFYLLLHSPAVPPVININRLSLPVDLHSAMGPLDLSGTSDKLIVDNAVNPPISAMSFAQFWSDN